RAKGEGRVAHPAVAVIPVALPARRLRQRSRERGYGGTRGHVGEALDRQGRALNVLPEAVIGDACAPQPPAPEAGRRRQPRVGLVDGLGGCEVLGPRQRAVPLLALAHHVPGADAAALDAEREVALQADTLARAGGDCRV